MKVSINLSEYRKDFDTAEAIDIEFSEEIYMFSADEAKEMRDELTIALDFLFNV